MADSTSRARLAVSAASHGMSINYNAGLGIIMGTVVVGTLHWAILVFIGYEKRLQAAVLTRPAEPHDRLWLLLR